MRVVDYNEYPELELGSLGAPPYSTETWGQAKKNGEIIKGIIDQAEQDGIGKVIFPKSEISFCYFTPKKAGHNKSTPVFYLKDKTEYDFCGSDWDVIFDSDIWQPYDFRKRKETAANVNMCDMPGKVMQTGKGAQNVIIRNLNLQGEMQHRTFIQSKERKVEFNRGLTFGQYANNTKIKNCHFFGFAGDSMGVVVNSGKSTNSAATWKWRDKDGGEPYVFKPGLIRGGHDDVNSSYGKYGTYITDPTTINREKLEEFWGTNKPFLCLRATRNSGGHISRRNPFANRYVDVLWLDEDDKVIEKEMCYYAHYVEVPPKAVKARLQIYKENGANADKNKGIKEVGYGMDYFLAIPFSTDIHIDDCIISDNYRGGFVNCGFETKITNTKFINNGARCGRDIPYFFDSTRYSINCEETFAHSLTLDGCEFLNGMGEEASVAHNILYDGYNLKIDNTDFQGGRAIAQMPRIGNFQGSNITAKKLETIIGTSDSSSSAIGSKIDITNSDIEFGSRLSRSQFENMDINFSDSTLTSLASLRSSNGILYNAKFKDCKLILEEKEFEYTSQYTSGSYVFDCKEVIDSEVEFKSNTGIYGLLGFKGGDRAPKIQGTTFRNCGFDYSSTSIDIVKFDNCDFVIDKTCKLFGETRDRVNNVKDSNLTVIYNECTFDNYPQIIPTISGFYPDKQPIKLKYSNPVFIYDKNYFKKYYSDFSFLNITRPEAYDESKEDYTIELLDPIFHIDASLKEDYRFIKSKKGDFKVNIRTRNVSTNVGELVLTD